MKRLQNTKFRVILLILMMLAGFFSFSSAISSLMNTVVMRGFGEISAANVTARSGSPEDIQMAVDAVEASGGGVVYVPEGDFEFNIDPGKIGPDNQPAGVIVPGGVSIIGQGRDRTILRQTEENPQYSHMFTVDGLNGKPVRISGIKFIGYVPIEEVINRAIVMLRAKDFRIDNNSFVDFASTAIAASNHLSPYGVNRGVIDHNDFDNPYKDTIGGIWGYGIIVIGTYYNWETNIDNLLGKYDEIENIVYIEDNTFNRVRHAISSNGGAWYVARANWFGKPRPYGSVDVHGSSGSAPAVGGRGLEAYNNQFEADGAPGTIAFQIRGGAGVIFNNTVYDHDIGIWLQREPEGREECAVKDLYIWGNTFIDTPEELRADTAYTENVDYFLYEKIGYSPYPYPHPLTLEATP